jgi:hypothetical protein
VRGDQLDVSDKTPVTQLSPAFSEELLPSVADFVPVCDLEVSMVTTRSSGLSR